MLTEESAVRDGKSQESQRKKVLSGPWHSGKRERPAEAPEPWAGENPFPSLVKDT